MRGDDRKGQALEVLRGIRDHDTRKRNDRLQAINEARANGATLAEIGQALGVTRQSIHRFLLYHGEGDVQRD